MGPPLDSIVIVPSVEVFTLTASKITSESLSGLNGVEPASLSTRDELDCFTCASIELIGIMSIDFVIAFAFSRYFTPPDMEATTLIPNESEVCLIPLDSRATSAE